MQEGKPNIKFDTVIDTMRLVTALIETEISSAEIPYLRGAMIRLSGENPLFHNHNVDGFNYIYPLVQCRRINGCAAVIGINQGGEALLRLFENGENFSLQLGRRKVEVESVVIRTERVQVVCGIDSTYTYAISRWLPLNRENYRAYQQAETLVDRITMLEKILVGNILSFAKGVGIFFDHPVECRILELEATGLATYKEVELMSFSAEFRCNIRLPEFIGLGKSVSVNHGVVNHIK